jgi:hypothetical protein
VVGDGWWSVLVFGVWCLVVGDDGVGVFFRCWVLTLALMMVLVVRDGDVGGDVGGGWCWC